MLSILIPIYNFDVRPFVKELHRQARKISEPIEIILADDASQKEFQKNNKELQLLENVSYIQLTENIGRAKIRNFLAEKASFPYLIFCDCDSQTSKSDFIKNYIQHIAPDTVICGGRSYATQKLSDKKKKLHQKYGIRREQNSAMQRAKFPHRSFLTNNYLIPKSIHLSVKFEEKLSKYGHEDTLFGIELKRRNIRIKHIDNPLIHIGLEDNYIFLNKTKQGVENLVKILKIYDYAELWEDIKLLRMYKKIKIATQLPTFLWKFVHNYSIFCLKLPCNSLFLFDLAKLSHFILTAKNDFSKN